jgi:hypothetical protein
VGWVGVCSIVLKSARASSGGVAVANTLPTVRIAFAPVLGLPNQCCWNENGGGEVTPERLRADCSDGRDSARRSRSTCGHGEAAVSASGGSLRGWPWVHPSPLGVDPTRVHVALSEPYGPGTFQNAPPYPCYIGGLSYALDCESRG